MRSRFICAIRVKYMRSHTTDVSTTIATAGQYIRRGSIFSLHSGKIRWKTVASEGRLRVGLSRPSMAYEALGLLPGDGAQEPECTQMYMRIPSTGRAQATERSRF